MKVNKKFVGKDGIRGTGGRSSGMHYAAPLYYYSFPCLLILFPLDGYTHRQVQKKQDAGFL